MIDDSSAFTLLSNLLKQEDRCYSKAKLKLIQIDDSIKDCRNNVQKSTNVIKECIHSANNQLEKLELNLCLELVEENQKQEHQLTKVKDELNSALSNYSKYTSDAKVKLIELDDADKENMSASVVKKILPNIKEIIKDFHVDPIKFIPMQLTIDHNNPQYLSIGYIQKYGLEINKFQLNIIDDFIVGSIATISVECEDGFEFSKFQDILSWDVECRGETVVPQIVMEINTFTISFTVERKGQYRISFKLLNQHVLGSPLHLYPTTRAEVYSKDGNFQKRKSSSTNASSDSDILSCDNQLSEDITSLVDDLPLFAQEFGDTCSIALSQFFSKNLPQQRNSEPTNKKLSTGNTKLVVRNINKINGNILQPLRKPKTEAAEHSKTFSPVHMSTDKFKTELSPSHKLDILTTKLTNYHAPNKKEIKAVPNQNVSFECSFVKKSADNDIQREVLLDESLQLTTSKMQDIFHSEPVKEMKSLRSHWNDNFAKNPKPIEQEQKNPTQFNQLLEKRLAANVSFCVKSSNEFGFKYPIGVAELKSLQIIVADTFNHRLLLFTSEGEFIELLKTSDVRLAHPSAIAVLPNGHFAVRDDKAIHLFESNGNYINSSKDFCGKHFGLAVDQLGHLLTVEINEDQLSIAVIETDGMNLVRRICVFGSDGNERLKASMPRFITFRPPNDLLIVDLGNDVVFIVDLPTGKTKKKFGTSGNEEGQFNDPSGIVCDAEGYIIVGDSRNHRIQVFTPDGEFVTVLRVNRPLRRPSGLFLSPSGGLFVLNYWEQSLVKYRLYVSRN